MQNFFNPTSFNYNQLTTVPQALNELRRRLHELGVELASDLHDFETVWQEIQAITQVYRQAGDFGKVLQILFASGQSLQQAPCTKIRGRGLEALEQGWQLVQQRVSHEAGEHSEVLLNYAHRLGQTNQKYQSYLVYQKVLPLAEGRITPADLAAHYAIAADVAPLEEAIEWLEEALAILKAQKIGVIRQLEFVYRLDNLHRLERLRRYAAS